MPNVPGEPGGTAMDIPADPGGLAVARFGHAPEDPGTDVETGAASPDAAPVVSSRPGASSDAQAEMAGPAAAVVAVTPSAPALFGHALPEGLWRRRWLLIVVVWGAAALALYVSPFGERMNPYLSLTGLFVGFLVGLTGMGGGALLTPILIFFFGFQPTLAIGTDITYAAVTKVFGSWRHFKQKTVDWRLALWLALGSIPAGLTGAYAVNYMKENYGEAIDEVLYMAIGSALMLVGVLLVIRIAMKLDRHYPVQDLRMSVPRKVATVFVGAATGFIIGLTSVGSGTLLAMALILFYPLATQRVVGTDVFHATLLLGATGLAQLRFGNVDLPMVAALLIGSIPGVIVGSHLTVRTSTRALRGVLAAVLFLSGLALLFKA